MPDTETKSATLIQTKLHRPRLRGDLVERPRLLAQLECGVEHKMTLISAPAGYGKTTLLCQWLETCPHVFAWLSLDGSDSDLDVFVSYMLAAIQTVHPGACGSTGELLLSPTTPPWDHLATVLVNDLAELPDPLTLALDDYHTIHDPKVHQFLAQVIHYLPQQVHLVIASRTDPPLAMDRLRASREVAEIRAGDLRFSERETEAYLARSLGPAIARESAAALGQRTEGWIVGLHLATLWLRDAKEPDQLLASFGGDTAQFVAEYLATEVLAHQPRKIRRFLLHTSILNRFSGELCDAVLELPPGSSAATLAELDRANLFLVPLGAPVGWYRYHHLFEEMLKAALHAQASQEEIASLNRRASEWFAADGQIEDALHHALAAGDLEPAVRLVEASARGLLNRLERHSLERWLALLPREVVWQRPKLLVVQAWLLYRQSRLSALEGVLDAAEACLEQDGGGDLGTESQALGGQIYTLRSATAYLLHEDFERCLVSAEHALAWLPRTERGARSTALGFWALAQQALGHQESAIHRLEETLRDPASHDLAETQIYLGLCLILLSASRLQQMLAVTRRFLALAAELEQANALVGANWLAGLALYEMDDLAAASQHFGQAYRLRYRSNLTATSNSAIGLARIHQVRGEFDQAQEMIDSVHAESLRLDSTDFLPWLEGIQAYQRLLQGETAPALRWAGSFDAGDTLGSALWFESPNLIQARILLAAGTTDQVRHLALALEEGLAATRKRHWAQRTIQISVHLALARDRLGETERALAHLDEALTLAEPGGFIRSFVDAGPQVRVLLSQIERPRANPHYVAEVLAAFDTWPTAKIPSTPEGSPTPPDVGQGLLLTRREEEILRLMQAGFTNKEISGELVISVHTVKRHATNIYRKLDVGGRREAIRQAQQLGILPTN